MSNILRHHFATTGKVYVEKLSKINVPLCASISSLSDSSRFGLNGISTTRSSQQRMLTQSIIPTSNSHHTHKMNHQQNKQFSSLFDLSEESKTRSSEKIDDGIGKTSDEEERPPGWELIMHSPPIKGKYPRGSLVGKVVSDKMQKTVNVAVDRWRIVPKYRKRMKYTRKFMAHDEEEECNMGDTVVISPSRRLSKMKHFIVKEILRKMPQL